jgi:hypothetical protein
MRHLLAIAALSLSMLAAGYGHADPSATTKPKPTLYVDQIDEGKGEVFVTYSYQTRFPPDAAEVLDVARARCRRMGFADASRTLDPTLR